MKCLTCKHESKKTYCSRICRETDEIRKSNELWLKRDVRQQKPRCLTNQNFHSSHLYNKEPQCLKKFKSVRG